MGGVIEEPSEKVGEAIKVSGEKMVETEEGNAGANVATKEEHEARSGEIGAWVGLVTILPTPTDVDVGDKSGEIKWADGEKRWEKIGKETEQDESERK